MGTSARIVADAPSHERALVASERALEALEATEARLSTWRPTSELSELNRSPIWTAFELSQSTHDELTRAMAWARASDGAFQPASGALTAAWDLRGEGRAPTPGQLSSAVLASGLGSIQLKPRSRAAYRTVANASIDAGAFGKGAGLDAALATAEDDVSLLVDLGGQLAWTVRSALWMDIAHPRQREQSICRIQRGARGSLATSGNSERQRTVDGAQVGHLFDPRSGTLAPNFGSATVFAPSALDADCLSTASFVLGPSAAIDWIDTLPGIDAVIIETTGSGPPRVHLSSGIKESCISLNANAQLVSRSSLAISRN